MAKKPSFFLRSLFSLAGATLGALAVVVYLNERQQREAAARQRQAKPARPKKEIKISPPEPIEEAAVPAVEELLLKITAKPRKFKRNNPGTIKVQTIPGASCIISARYSTGRAPNKLDTSPAIAGGDGELTWSWEVGTSGSYVDITITAEAEGYEPTSGALRVNIGE
jgi:hypothetical protein